MAYEIDPLLSEFGRSVGLELAFDEARQCFFLVDEKIVAITQQEEAWVLYGMVAVAAADADGPVAELWGAALSLNLSQVHEGSGAMALQAGTGALMYVDRVELPCDLPAMRRRFEHFCNRHAQIVLTLASK